LAAGELGRRLGDYVKNLTNKYLMLSAAGIIFLIAIIFAILAIFWALISRNHDPVISAAIMAGALALIGCLTVFIAYGITTGHQSVRQELTDPGEATQAKLPSVEDVGRQIERAVRQYGPFRVTAAAAAGGLAAGVLAKRFGPLPPSSHPRGPQGRNTRSLSSRPGRAGRGPDNFRSAA
jgi:hypothetical protein